MLFAKCCVAMSTNVSTANACTAKMPFITFTAVRNAVRNITGCFGGRAFVGKREVEREKKL
jgi:hypothetical protein